MRDSWQLARARQCRAFCRIGRGARPARATTATAALEAGLQLRAPHRLADPRGEPSSACSAARVVPDASSSSASGCRGTQPGGIAGDRVRPFISGICASMMSDVELAAAGNYPGFPAPGVPNWPRSPARPAHQVTAKDLAAGRHCRRPAARACRSQRAHAPVAHGGRIGGQRHREIEGRALARRALDADLAAHQLHQLLADRQAQAGAAVLAGGGAVFLGEGLEDGRRSSRA